MHVNSQLICLLPVGIFSLPSYVHCTWLVCSIVYFYWPWKAQLDLRYLFFFVYFVLKLIFNLGLCPDHSIVEEEGEEYDDVDEDLKAQILSRNEAEQEKETTAEEGSDMSQCFDGSLCAVLSL